MKTSLITLITCLISPLLFSQTNFALYTINNTYTVCFANNQNSFYGVSWKNNQQSIKEFNLETGSILKEFKDLPENPVKLMIADPKKNLLYLITARKTDDTKNRYADAIYELNTKNDKLKLLSKVHYDHSLPNKVHYVDGNLVFTTLQEATWLFDLKTNSFSNLWANIHYQMLSPAPSRNGFLMLHVNNIVDNKVPVYFMDKDHNLSNRIAFVNQNVKLSTDKRNFQLPTITLLDSSYSSLLLDLRYQCFPLNNFQISMRPYWLKQAYVLDKSYNISGILAANTQYMITRSGNSISVYNHNNPNHDAPASFTDADVEKLQNYLKERENYDRELISSEALENVFDALFFRVFKKNRLKQIMVQYHGALSELKEYTQLLPLLQPDYKINNEKQANLFQDALDILFPVESFNKKFIANYPDKNNWVFVRGEAFSKKVGLVLILNDAQEIENIIYKSDLDK